MYLITGIYLSLPPPKARCLARFWLYNKFWSLEYQYSLFFSFTVLVTRAFVLQINFRTTCWYPLNNLWFVYYIFAIFLCLGFYLTFKNTFTFKAIRIQRSELFSPRPMLTLLAVQFLYWSNSFFNTKWMYYITTYFLLILSPE